MSAFSGTFTNLRSGRRVDLSYVMACKTHSTHCGAEGEGAVYEIIMGRKVKSTEELVTYGGNYSEPKFMDHDGQDGKAAGA